MMRDARGMGRALAAVRRAAEALRRETDAARKGGDDDGDGTCMVCLTALAGGDRDLGGVVRTRCGHEFHSHCLGSWVAAACQALDQPRCPVCRGGLGAEPEVVVIVDDDPTSAAGAAESPAPAED